MYFTLAEMQMHFIGILKVNQGLPLTLTVQIIGLGVACLAMVMNICEKAASYNCSYVFHDQSPSFRLQKTSDFATTTANLGDDITYTYEIKNAGVTYIENISINDDHRSKGSFTDPNNETATVTTDAHHTGDSVNTNSSNGTWDQLGPGDVLTVTTTYKVTEADIIAYGTE